MFFSAVDDTGQQELGSSDATTPGTIKVGDIGGLVGGNPEHLSAGRYSLLFSAFTVDAGRELWFVNSVYLIKDIKTTFDGGTNDSYPQWLTLFDGKGSEKDWGDSLEGGLVAVLKGKPELTADDFTVLA